MDEAENCGKQKMNWMTIKLRKNDFLFKNESNNNICIWPRNTQQCSMFVLQTNLLLIFPKKRDSFELFMRTPKTVEIRVLFFCENHNKIVKKYPILIKLTVPY